MGQIVIPELEKELILEITDYSEHRSAHLRQKMLKSKTWNFKGRFSELLVTECGLTWEFKIPRDLMEATPTPTIMVFTPRILNRFSW